MKTYMIIKTEKGYKYGGECYKVASIDEENYIIDLQYNVDIAEVSGWEDFCERDFETEAEAFEELDRINRMEKSYN